MANWQIVYKTKLGSATKVVSAKTESEAKESVKKDKMFVSMISCKKK